MCSHALCISLLAIYSRFNLSLLLEPAPADSSTLKGYDDLLRVDQGEYRIVYRFDEKSVSVLVVGKRK